MPRISASSIEEHKAQTRRRLLSAAAELFEKNGYAAVSHADVAAVAGIARTTFYQYFASKEDLLVALVDDSLPELIEKLVAGIPRNVSYREQLAELLQRLLHFVATDHVFGFVFQGGADVLSKPARARIGEAHAGLGAEVARIYRAGVDSGELRPLPAGLAGHLLQDIVMSGGRMLLALPEPKQQVHEISEALVQVLFDGLAV